MRVSLLQSLKELLSEFYPFARYQSVFDSCFDILAKNNSAKIQNVCLLTVRRCLDLFSKDFNGPSLGKAVGLVNAKIKEFDSDKAIKISVCKCLGVLLKKYRLNSADLILAMDSLAQKLKIEVEKIYIVDTLACFGKEQVLNKDVIRSVEGAIRQTAESLGSSNYELNMKVVQTIDHLLGFLARDCSIKLMEELLQKSKILLGEGKTPSFVRHIANHQPRLLQPYSELIVKSTESAYIVALINSKVIDVNSCLKILRGIDHDKARKVSETVGAMRLDERQILKEVDESPWGRVMAMALGYVGSDKTLPTLNGYLRTFKSEEAKNDVCSAIGIILSKDPDQLLSSFLGKVGKDTDIYSSLFILKEMLSLTRRDFKSLSYLIEWLFGKSEEKLESESSYYIIAECVGRLAFLSPEATRKVVGQAQASHVNRRLVVASSLRFALESEGVQFNEDLLDEYIAGVGIYCAMQSNYWGTRR